MKRRNAESVKMRRPVKRTKITEGMYGNSFMYVKFLLAWVTVVIADYMLEFRLEFLWPVWMMIRSIHKAFTYEGIMFTVFFTCLGLTSDLICFFFIPLQYVFLAASIYVWVHLVYYILLDKGVCLPTVAMWCLVVYVESALREARDGPLELWRPLAAHSVGFLALSLGFKLKAFITRLLRLRREWQARAENEFYFQLMRDALPESALVENQMKEERVSSGPAEPPEGAPRRRCARLDDNGLCLDHASLHVKLEKLEKHLVQQTLNREREKLAQGFSPDRAAQAPGLEPGQAQGQGQGQAPGQAQGQAQGPTPPPAPHAHTNGSPPGADDHEVRQEIKVSAKMLKYEKKEASTSLREEKRKNRNKDKEREKDNYDHSHKSTEHVKDNVVKEKEFESTKESNRDSSFHSRDRERDRENKEKEKERERERERELRAARECAEELRRARAELAGARAGEAEARRALAAAAAAERQRRAEHAQLRQAHAALQHKATSWRAGERAALERRFSEERRARVAAELLLRTARTPPSICSNGECENEACALRARTSEAEANGLRRDLQRMRDRVTQIQRELLESKEQVGALEEAAAGAAGAAAGSAGALAALQERAAHLERALSAETRVKLDLLSALGDAKRQMLLHEGIISQQEKQLSELKAQMVAVMPAELMLQRAPLDPNACVYTPKQLCSDA